MTGDSVMIEEIKVVTPDKMTIIDITNKVEQIVEKMQENEGLCTIIVQHSTAAITLQEDETGLIQDFYKKIRDLFFQGQYQHDRIDRNAAAHLAASFIGHTLTIPVRNGRLLRGTWQQILFVELDGPRSRTVIIKT
ncbi:MAG: secondary thiamine-phosphate synthase enzyme YjbQ [Candidatus Hodarchaeales archaeon]